ncbi:MAG: hypothetical protein IMZ64_00410, partial [Bacteroidetes bacterium]|nr:hypothetical protein [Bacteroidota bacterium]
PLDAEGRWRKLIKEIRDHYKGSVVWALPYPDGVMRPPKFITEVDQVYVLWSAQLTGKNNSSSQADMTARMGQLLDEGLLPLKNSLKKPIIVAIKYASVTGSAAGCVKSNDKCLQFSTLDQPVPNNPDVQLDLKGQQDIYNAILVAINQRKWVDGIVSRGYYPPTVLQDKSSSIHGKPAADSLWYWYPRMLTQAPK